MNLTGWGLCRGSLGRPAARGGCLRSGKPGESKRDAQGTDDQHKDHASDTHSTTSLENDSDMNLVSCSLRHSIPPGKRRRN